ncbi:MAG: [FeFe] hydrogenase H-cluster maturation GTPase HydF [Oligoflexia bacterium]|nr:[FeFe] hydrogenase H-cluster maturation GTPase HydF [Oligoflexia bacterium]
MKNNLKANLPHLGILGKRNVGKSSLMNLLIGQDISIVTDQPGTTTDPVKKQIELGDFGAAVLIDTAGIDDQGDGDLSLLRVKASRRIIEQLDFAIIVIAENDFNSYEEELISTLISLKTPYIVIHNKKDLQTIDPNLKAAIEKKFATNVFEFSNKFTESRNRDELVRLINKHFSVSILSTPSIIGDLVNYGDLVVLVTPIDKEAPKGRLILPQVQTIRDALDNDCIVTIVKERELDIFLKKINIEPKLVVTDSQEFLKVAATVPSHIPLTSFSILFARLKNDFNKLVSDTYKISELKDGDKVLISESCSHHASGDDIGRVKIPRWISNFTGKKIIFETVSGHDDLPANIAEYALLIQCGGCMLTRKQILNRMQKAIDKNVPITNYGMVIAYTQGIFSRAISSFFQYNGKDLNYSSV